MRVAGSSSPSEMSNSKQDGRSVRGACPSDPPRWVPIGPHWAGVDDREMFQLRGKDLQASHRKAPSSQRVIRDSARTVTRPDKALPGVRGRGLSETHLAECRRQHVFLIWIPSAILYFSDFNLKKGQKSNISGGSPLATSEQSCAACFFFFLLFSQYGK